MLARLAAASGRVVLTERLLAEVWPEAPAGRTRQGAVAQVVHRLRRLLGDRDGEFIATRPQGYELRIPDVEIDARRRPASHRARPCPSGLRRRGCRDRAAGPGAGSVARGAVCGHRVRRSVRRGRPARCASRRGCGSRRSSLGSMRIWRCAGTGEVIDELAYLIAGDPLYEPWWPRLMLSLDGAGRRADALYTYQRLRTLLVDGLGVGTGAGGPARPSANPRG
ncbi:AfsR/SARP family transcriptional regulator [Yinghuangia aomiensis]